MIMGTLAFLCILGIVTFIRERNRNYIWRWICLSGGAYVLFDLYAIAAGLGFWQGLRTAMFDVTSPYWNIIWGSFVLLGTAVFVLGIRLLAERKRQGLS